MEQGWSSLAAEMMYICMPGGLPANELAFYERRIRANGGAALDQACGTGRHIFPLLAQGLEVYGADISADALSFARREAKAQNVNPVLYHQRMEECDLSHRYGTIYVAKGLTINDVDHPIIWEPDQRRGAEGQIVTTLWTESVDLLEQTLLSKRRYDLYIGGQVVRSEVHAHWMRWYFHYEILMMLEQAGYKDLVTYGDYTGSPATKDSQTVVYGGRRPLNSCG